MVLLKQVCVLMNSKEYRAFCSSHFSVVSIVNLWIILNCFIVLIASLRPGVVSPKTGGAKYMFYISDGFLTGPSKGEHQSVLTNV